MQPKLHLTCFGTPQFLYGNQPVTGFISNKARALLIYLAVTGRAHSRDALAELLWADNPKTKRDNLKKALNNLRKLDGVILVEEGHYSVSLDPSAFDLDVQEFSRLPASLGNNSVDAIANIENSAALYQADFLSGFNPSLSLEFEAWVLSVQTELKLKMLDLLYQLVDRYEEQALHSHVISTLRRILQFEPWQEEAHRRLMVQLAETRNWSAALAQFEMCRKCLRTELDVEPSRATLALAEQIRNHTFVPSPTGRPATMQPRTLASRLHEPLLNAPR